MRKWFILLLALLVLPFVSAVDYVGVCTLRASGYQGCGDWKMISTDDGLLGSSSWSLKGTPAFFNTGKTLWFQRTNTASTGTYSLTTWYYDPNIMFSSLWISDRGIKGQVDDLVSISVESLQTDGTLVATDSGSHSCGGCCGDPREGCRGFTISIGNSKGAVSGRTGWYKLTLSFTDGGGEDTFSPTLYHYGGLPGYESWGAVNINDSFKVVNSAGPLIFCGNAVCESPLETTDTCPADCVESNNPLNCFNYLDDDADTKIDFEDVDCQKYPVCNSWREPAADKSRTWSIYGFNRPWYAAPNGYDGCCGDDDWFNGDFER